MTLHEFLISVYPAKRIAWFLFKKKLPESWNEELLDFASYSLRTMFLQLLHKQIPELSLTDVMFLSYPLGRLFDVLLRKRRKFPWKAEVKALISSWICYFSMEVLVSKVLLDESKTSIIKPLAWSFFLVMAMNGVSKLFPILPLPAIVNVDELVILPLCAAVAEYCPLFISHTCAVFCVLNIYLGILTGLIIQKYVLRV